MELILPETIWPQQSGDYKIIQIYCKDKVNVIVLILNIHETTSSDFYFFANLVSSKKAQK